MFRVVVFGFILLLMAYLIVAHGVRGITIAIVLGAALTLPRTRGWQAIERALIRVTGSRRRALVVVTITVIGVLAAINIYEFIHP